MFIRLCEPGILPNIADVFGLSPAHLSSDDKPERHSGLLSYNALSSQVRKDPVIAFAYVAKFPCNFFSTKTTTRVTTSPVAVNVTTFFVTQ